MTHTVSIFQSYIIHGYSKKKVREKTISLAKSLGIDLGKNSPDVFIISLEKTSITIEQIRNLKSHIFQKPLALKFKFIIIENAHLATAEAQNALLKIFEEPPSHAIIVLESASKEGLLPTIVSRAIIIKTKLDQQEAEDIPPNKNLESALLKIAEVGDPKQFLDDQIIALTDKLTEGIHANQYKSALISDIEKYKEAKLAIAANVNPTFVLTNLAFSLSIPHV